MRINDNWKKITAIWKIKLVMCLRMIAGWGEGFSEDWIFSTSLRLKLCLDTENISFNHQDHFLPKAITLLSSSFALKAPCTVRYSADYVCISHFFLGGGDHLIDVLPQRLCSVRTKIRSVFFLHSVQAPAMSLLVVEVNERPAVWKCLASLELCIFFWNASRSGCTWQSGHMINVSLNRNKTFQILICWSGWIIWSPAWFLKLDHSHWGTIVEIQVKEERSPFEMETISELTE